MPKTEHSPHLTAKQLNSAILAYADIHGDTDPQPCSKCNDLMEELDKSIPARNMLSLNINTMLTLISQANNDEELEQNVTTAIATFCRECLQLGAMAVFNER